MFNAGTVLALLVVLLIWLALSGQCYAACEKVGSVIKSVLPSSGDKATPTPATTSAPAAPTPVPAVAGFSDVISPMPAGATAAVSDDYNQAIQRMALEDQVVSSHKKFATELAKKTSTSSKFVLRDDPNDVVPWVGLRRPQYHSYSRPLDDARVTSSEDPSQLHEKRTFML